MASTTPDPQAVADSLAAQAAVSQTAQFLMVYASIIDGHSWCGDCRRAEPLMQTKFPTGQPPRLTTVYAGGREAWRNPENAWRKWGVPALPTLYKVTPDGSWSKLVEADCYHEQKLDAFISAASAL